MSYLKDKTRMVNSITGKAQGCTNAKTENCNKCPLSSFENKETPMDCVELECTHPEQAEKIVSDWCAEHPAKTRKIQLLEMFPNAIVENLHLSGIDSIMCNQDIDNCTRRSLYGNCSKCTEAYWNEEL